MWKCELTCYHDNIYYFVENEIHKVFYSLVYVSRFWGAGTLMCLIQSFTG
jgi:hypothetical protein